MRRIRTGRLALAAGAIAGAAALAGSLAVPDASEERGGGADLRSRVEFREHYQRGIELSRQGLLEGALAEFKRCLEIDPDHADLRFQVGRILAERSMKEGQPLHVAIDHFERAVRLDPKHAPARHLLALLSTRRFPPGTYNPVRASRLYEELLREHPGRNDVRMEYAKWLSEGEVRLPFPNDPNRVTLDSSWSLEIARSHLEKVLDTAPPGSEMAMLAHGWLGEILMKMGEYDAARRRIEFVLETFDLRPAARALALQKIGHCRRRLGEHAASAKAFREAHGADPLIEYLWDLRIAYEALGGYPKELPPSLRFEVREDPAPPGADLLAFEEAGRRLRVDKWAGAGPAAWADVDGDGREDLMACGCDTFCTLWRAGDGEFTDATLPAGLGRLESGFAAVFADYDGDGDVDFYVARNGWNGPAPNSLMRNDGRGRFTDVTAAAGADATGSSFNATWADLNRDGWLDLIVTQGVTADGSVNRLFLNKGDGTFRDATEASGLLEKPGLGTIGVAVGDYDGDGWLDIFFHGRFAPNRLYKNLGNGTFRDVASEAGVAGTADQNGYVAFLADVDADGDLDILAASLAAWPKVLEAYRPGWAPSGPEDLVDAPRLWRNEGGGRFTDQSRAAGLARPIGVMSGGMADLDNDGYPEVVFGTGDPQFARLEPNVLLKNDGGRRFVDLSRRAGVDSLGKGHGVAFNDWDRDGDLDLYFQLGGFYHGDFWHSQFFLNKEGQRNNWLSVSLEQPGPNRRAVGAGAALRAGDLRTYQEVRAGEGFGSTSPPRLHFGLGKREKVEALEVRWPDGTRQTFKDLPVNRRVRMTKGEAAWRGE